MTVQSIFWISCFSLVLCLAGANPIDAQTAPSSSLRIGNDEPADLYARLTAGDGIEGFRTFTNRSFFQDEQPDANDAEPTEPPTYPWSLSFELGGSGSRGNTDEDNIHTSVRAHRETPKITADFGIDYRFSQTNGSETKNQTFIFGRREWPIAASPWTVFVGTSVELDEFKQFDARWATNAGFGFRAIAKENEKLQLNVGSGFSKEFGSTDDDYKPEALLGLLYRNQLNANVVLTGTAEYFPNIEDWIDDYRLRGEAALEVALTEGKDWWLKLSVEDRYDNTPNGPDEANDFYYGVSLLFKF